MQVFERRISGELDFTVPREWPPRTEAAAALEQRVRRLAGLIARFPAEAVRADVARQVLREAADGLEALWPVPARRPGEVASAIKVARGGFGGSAG